MDPTPGGLDPRLIGREQARAFLWSHYQAALNGQASVVLIEGSPGIGKTYLLDLVAEHARQQGVSVLRGGASEAEGMPPYLAFLEALGQHIRTTSADELRAQIGSLAPVLTTILPELPQHLGELPVSYPLPVEQARLRLYEAVATLLETIAASQGLVLLLDDLQWTDTATLDLLCYLARHQQGARLLVLGAYREGEVAQRPAFERALAELARSRRLKTLTLGPLAGTEMALLVTTQLGAPLDQAGQELLLERSEGNPFFAEELLREWLETGAIRRTEAGFGLGAASEAALPASIINAVRQRLARLSPALVELLRTAAMIGRTFEGTLLAEATSREAEALEEELQEAIQAQLLRSDGAGTLAFSHDTIRACLYDEVGSVRRRRLHMLIGRLLERRLEQAEGPIEARMLASLAFHFVRSGDRELGAAYSQQAAVLALRALAPEEALGHYRTALTLLVEDAPQRGACLLGRGEAALLTGDFQEAVEAFAAGLEWWRERDRAGEAGRAALGLGRAYWRREEIGPARVALEQAVAWLAERHDGEKVQALIELGSLLTLSLHEFEEAGKWLEQALEVACLPGNERLEAAANRALGVLWLRTGDVEGAALRLEQALVKADEANDAWEATEICASLSLAYRWAGSFDRQQEVLQRWLVYARRCHDPYQLRHLYAFLAVGYALRGRRVEAEEALEEGRRIVEQLASPEPLAMLLLTEGSLLGLWGDLERAEELTREAIGRFRELEPHSLVWWLGGLGFMLALQDRREEALALLDELEALIAPLPVDAVATTHMLCYMGAIVTLLGEREWGEHLYPRLLPFRGRMHAFAMDRLLGSLAMLRHDFPAARMHLAEAEQMTRRCEIKVELAATLMAQAELELAERGRGGVALARLLLKEALVLTEQAGYVVLQRRLAELLQQLARKGSRPQLPARLSPREAEVLRLVARGRSNRQIAEELVISERTVANHLASIFLKAGVENRAGATAFAIRHDLAE